MTQKILYTNHVEDALNHIVEELNAASIFILVDKNTENRVLPRLQSLCSSIADAGIITVAAGDENKNADTLMHIWKELSNRGATRKSILINLGGGVITDIGGFAASTFKRGIKFINIPTTLLSAVDASLGGKTGINFNGLKNEIGIFKEADAVIISTVFFGSLPQEEIKSGYAEMIKHGLISDKKTLNSLLSHDISDINPDEMLNLVETSTEIKKDIVKQDPLEHNIRKALNFGHSVAHAFEALAMERKSPVSHGYAVAFGMVIETVVSVIKKHFPVDTMRRIASYIYSNYGAFSFTCEDYESILNFMSHDKKNAVAGKLNLTLLKDIGEIEIDCLVTPEEMTAAFDIYREELQK